MAENSIFTSSSSSIVGGLLSAIARNKIESIVLHYIVKNKKEETQMKVIKRKRCILNHRGRIRSSKFTLSRYCGCVRESFVGCVRFVFSIPCLFVFVVSSKIMK